MKPRPYQSKVINETKMQWFMGNNNVLAVAPTGAGKCLGINTPILMYDGSIKPVQDVVQGDLLMGVDSTPRTVYSTTTGRETMYKITPIKGDSYIVNESHILSLKRTNLRNNPRYPCENGKPYEIVNISVKDYLKKSDYFKHTHKGWRTDVKWDEKELPDLLPPYLLGVWLGDGSTNQPEITSADIEIVNYLKQYVGENGLGLSVGIQPNNKSKVYRITNERKKLTGLIPLMRSYNLLGYKHIPKIYKVNSRENRLELLAGILDSDGHLAKNSYYDVTLKSEKLMDDLVFLARSLGFAAHKKSCSKKCCNTGVVGDYFRTTICGDVSIIPTKLDRHQPEPRKQKKSVLVTGITVEKLEVGDYYGFDISGDRLFMLGDFTVTHNTVIKAFMAKTFSDRGELVVIFAHRDILLSQISMTLAKVGLPHKFICSKATEREIGDLHVAEFGHSFISENSNIIVSSVLTWVNRDTEILDQMVKCWMIDECHHFMIGSAHDKCTQPMINAKGMGVTATPLRADQKGLGRDASGVFDTIVLAPTMGELIESGSLSPYRIYTVPSELDLTGVNVTGSGDYNQKKLAAASDTADITGDAVEHYKRLSYGKQAITFCVSIDHAKHVAQQFNDAGIPSVALSSKTPLAIRQRKFREFKAGHIMNLVNVDLFGEGADVPACTTVIMLRKTMSYGLFMQQFGRMLRLFDTKEYGILLDHVGNVAEHCIYGSPHDSPEWSLKPPKKKKKNTQDEKALNTRTCPKCFAFYMPKSNTPKDYICPYCNHAETEDEINTAMREVQVREGTLVEYDDSYLTGLLRERDNVDVPVDRIRQKLTAAPDVVKHSAAKNHLKRQEAQRQLRTWIQSWCEHIAAQKQLNHETVQGEFARIFGKDVFQAQVLGERQALELLDKIKNSWSNHILPLVGAVD